MKEGQERSLNLLITLSANFPFSHSLTLMAVCAVAQSCCSQKCRLVALTAPPAEGLQGVEVNVLVRIGDLRPSA